MATDRLRAYRAFIARATSRLSARARSKSRTAFVVHSNDLRLLPLLRRGPGLPAPSVASRWCLLRSPQRPPTPRRKEPGSASQSHVGGRDQRSVDDGHAVAPAEHSRQRSLGPCARLRRRAPAAARWGRSPRVVTICTSTFAAPTFGGPSDFSPFSRLFSGAGMNSSRMPRSNASSRS